MHSVLFVCVLLIYTCTGYWPFSFQKMHAEIEFQPHNIVKQVGRVSK